MNLGSKDKEPSVLTCGMGGGGKKQLAQLILPSRPSPTQRRAVFRVQVAKILGENLSG